MEDELSRGKERESDGRDENIPLLIEERRRVSCNSGVLASWSGTVLIGIRMT